MKRLKKGIFPLIIGLHIVLRIVFSNTFTNDDIVKKTSNIMPKVSEAEKLEPKSTFSIKKSDLASLSSH